MKNEYKLILFAVAAIWFAACSDDTSGSNGDDASQADNAITPQNQSTDDNQTSDTSTGVIQFPGAGISGSGDALEPGIPPETADECNANTTTGITTEVIQQDVECFYSEDEPNVPAASIEQVVEVVADQQWVHLRLTLDPSFVDNTYGETAIGWEDSKKGEHTFKDLVGSDHAEMLLYDADGNLTLHFKLDYISEDETSPSGYSTLGVTGGDGKMIVGDAEDILGVSTSLNRNLNGCELVYTVDSPATDAQYSLPENAEKWDFRVVYEVWVDAATFGDAGFGKAVIENVHASPSKQEDNTIEVVPGDCPVCDPAVEDCDPWKTCDPTIEDCGSDGPSDSDDDTDNDTGDDPRDSDADSDSDNTVPE
ncbi:MAG: hypothetical protein JXX29_05590 [Deltaproteobacteria bacterium]|nr:hypothetical protein [Deltaproteobacteria bacterium]MBN2671122.1 hypothetical protein [Deltaproteobacteria bacterium]